MRFTSEDVEGMQKFMASKRVRAFLAKPHSPTATEAVSAEGELPRLAMNKWEQRYAVHLEILKAAGEVVWYRFEGITLKLAPDCRYTPDFLVMLKDGSLELHEVKGFWRDDAKVKCRLAADLFPFPVLIVKPEGVGWDVQTIRKEAKP